MASTRAIEAGKAIIRVMLDRAEVDKDLKDMEARFRAASSTISSLGKSLVASGAAMGGTLILPLRYAANLEKVGVAYRSIVGDADRAAAALADVKELAASTPFQFPELASAGQKLLAFGTASDQLAGELRRIGDVSAAIGAPIGEVAEVYGKAKVQGRLFAEDINQLTGRGIPIIGELAKQFGVTSEAVKDLVKDGEVNFGHLQNAMIAMTSQGGFAFQMMAQQSQTFLGKLSTLVDDAMEAILPIGTELMAVVGPAMERVSQIVGVLGNKLQATEGLATSWLLRSAGAIAFGLSLIALSKAIAAVNVVMTVMRGGLIVLNTLWTITKVIIIAMTAAWIATQLAIYAVTAAVVAAGIAVRTFGATTVITTIATKAWQAITLAARGAMLLLTNAVTLGKVAMGSYLAITSAMSVAQSLLTGRLVAGYFATRGLVAGSAILASAFGVQAIATTGLSAVQTIATTVTGFLTGAIGSTTVASGISAAAAGGLASAWATASGVIAAAYAVITSPLIPLYLAITAVVAAMAVVAAVVAVSAVSAGVFADAWNYVKESLGGILVVVQQVAGGLKDALAAGQYMQAAQILWAGIRQLFWMGVRATINAFRELPGYIWETLKTIASRTVSTLWNLFKSIPSLLMTALTGGDISSAISAVMGTGDWLEGLATDRIVDAQNEMQGLAADAKAAAAAAQNNGGVPGMEGAGGALGGPGASPLINKEEESAIQKRMKSLRDEVRELELGAAAAEDAKLIEEAKANGASEATIRAELAALDMMRKRKQYLEDEADATEKASEALVKKIDAQASDLAERGMSADEIYKRQIEALDKNVGTGRVSGEDAASAKEQAAIDRDERLKSRADEGKQLAESLKTPLEKFNDEVLRIQGLRASGNITGDTANRAIARERETLAQATNGSIGGANSTELGIATLGSKEAFDAIARSRSASVGSDIGPRVSPEMRAQLAAVNRQVQATEQLPARFAESVQAQVVAAINTKRLEDIAMKQLSVQNRLPAILQTIERNTRADGGPL